MSGSATTDAIVGRVMIVDDDPIVSGMLGVTLEAAGHSVAEMESGDAALASLAARPADALPEVLFVDIEMPGMNGYALCRQLEGYDEIVVDHLMETIAKDGYRMQTLIAEIITSYPFVNHRIQEQVTTSPNGK